MEKLFWTIVILIESDDSCHRRSGLYRVAYCVELLNADFDVTVFDNFCNSHPEALARVERITGKKLRIVRGD